MREFLQAEAHVSPEELYDKVKERDKTIGQATVYRTLKLFTESGIAREVDFRDGVTRFEQGYDHSHHDHLICRECGKNIEVVDEQIEELQKKLAEKYNFKLIDHEMYLYGECGECRK